jgi:hypothetical protein
MNINADDLVLVLHDGARAADRKTLSAVLDTMADSLADLAEHRERGDHSYRQDEIAVIRTHGSRETGR